MTLGTQLRAEWCQGQTTPQGGHCLCLHGCLELRASLVSEILLPEWGIGVLADPSQRLSPPCAAGHLPWGLILLHHPGGSDMQQLCRWLQGRALQCPLTARHNRQAGARAQRHILQKACELCKLCAGQRELV